MINANQIQILARVAIAKKLCSSLEAVGIEYGILHGAEKFPQEVGRDLDILISKENIDGAKKIISTVAKEDGWKILPAPIFWAGYPIIVWKNIDNMLVTFEMHLIQQLEWGGIILAAPDPNDAYLDQHIGVRVTRAGAVSKRLLILILAGCWDRLKQRAEEMVLHDEEKVQSIKHMTRLFGHKNAMKLIRYIDQSDIDGMEKIALSLRITLFLRALNPFSKVDFSLKWIIGKICRKIGWIKWKLPNLIITSNSEEYSTSILSCVIKQLSFTKAMIIDNHLQKTIFQKLNQHHKIRMHQALFRYVSVASSHSSIDSYLTIIGKSNRNSGNLFIELEENNKVVSVKTHFSLGDKERTLMYEVKNENCVSNIAATYLLAAQATIEGIEVFDV